MKKVISDMTALHAEQEVIGGLDFFENLEINEKIPVESGMLIAARCFAVMQSLRLKSKEVTKSDNKITFKVRFHKNKYTPPVKVIKRLFEFYFYHQKSEDVVCHTYHARHF